MPSHDPTDSLGDTLSAGATVPAGALAPPTSDAHTLPATGARGASRLDDDGSFGDRYRLGETIGAGGMGEVLSCRDGRIGREVALKVVRRGREGSQPDLASRFLREARVQGQLEHPSVVPVYDLGLDPSGAPYFTMKRVHGKTLEAILEELRAGDAHATQVYTRRKLLAAFSSVCLAVEFAHARGVLHRDLKPGNVMLGDFGEVYVLDWGLAKLADAAAETRAPTTRASAPDATDVAAPPREGAAGVATHTADGEMMGTLGYMPPEQVRGELSSLDARTDVYALGAILFELLTLERLHARRSAAELLASTIEGADARASVRAPAREIAPELDAICERATAVRPEDRFPTARDLSQAIERFLDGDRDVALRRELAAGHAESAAVAAERTLHPDAAAADKVAARSQALRDVGRALALDPTNAAAMRTLVRLLGDAPRELPPGALADRERAVDANRRGTGLLAAIGWASFFLYLPFGALRGVSSVPNLAVCVALWVLAASLSYLVYRGLRVTRLNMAVVLLVTMSAIGSIALDLGPFIIVPSLAMVSTWMFVMSESFRRQWVVIAACCLPVLVPIALEWLGVISPFYAFTDGKMIVLPHELHMPAAATQAYLLLANLGIIITAGVVAIRMRRSLTVAEERMHAFAWQLRQLIPDEAQAAVGSAGKVAPVPPPACFVDRL